ncbi:reverse transcriptase (RNA-dependent DNA polymerase) domain-containing protein [Phthorimaea operculella]|nr:reverse transcriptase (RNA-dependent DNA polymerase) domain-containing protein [Phthorimaea operculella]
MIRLSSPAVKAFTIYELGSAILTKKLLCHNDANSIYLEPLTPNEIGTIIRSLRNTNATGYDNISTKVIKFCTEELLQPLTHLVNLSFENGLFPNLLKKSIVIPLHKKGPLTSMENYRPITLVPILSKIFEKAMKLRLLNFFAKFKVIKPEHFGFQPHKSTTLAMFHLVREIVQHINANKRITTVFFDMTRAFDFVSHDLLLLKLENLGVTIDRHLDWQHHVENVRNKLHKYVYVLSRLRHTSAIETTLAAYHGYVASVLKYGLLLWGNSTNIEQLFIAQKKCVRAICGKKPRESCVPLFKELGILPLPCLYILEVYEDRKYIFSNLLGNGFITLKKEYVNGLIYVVKAQRTVIEIAGLGRKKKKASTSSRPSNATRPEIAIYSACDVMYYYNGLACEMIDHHVAPNATEKHDVVALQSISYQCNNYQPTLSPYFGHLLNNKNVFVAPFILCIDHF